MVRRKEQFRTIGIIGRMGSVKVVETLRRLKLFLAADGFHVVLEETTSTVLPGHGLQVCS